MIVVDGKQVVRIRPNRYRDDLKDSSGFQYDFAQPLKNAAQVRVIITETGEDLGNSPIDPVHQIRTVSPAETAWSKDIDMPDEIEMKRIGSPSADIFVRQGTRIAKTINDNITDFGNVSPQFKVLDFGCGVGRVLLPVSRLYEAKWHGCDVNCAADRIFETHNSRCADADYQLSSAASIQRQLL